MKVAFIVDKFPVLSQTFILDQITGLLDLGVDVEIFADTRAGTDKVHPDVRKYRLEERTYYSEDITKNKILRIIRSLDLILRAGLKHPIRVLRFVLLLLIRREGAPLRTLCWIRSFFDKNFDIIHCHFGPNGIKALPVKEAGIASKIITTFHGYDLSRYLKENGPQVYEELFKKGDLFMPVSEHWKQKMIQIGCNKVKIVVHHMGIDTERFVYSRRSIKSDELVQVLTIGRLTQKKGYEYAIEAVAALIALGRKIVYTITGEGPLENRLKSLVKKLGIETNVRFTGAVDRDEALRLYQQAHLFVLPSITADDGDQEGVPVVLMEAQAAGLPVVSTYHSGIPEVVIDGHSGLLTHERDVDALKEKLDYLIKNPQEWERIGKCGHDFVCTNYDIRNLNQRLFELYQEILKE